jgi:hypothetical protein
MVRESADIRREKQRLRQRAHRARKKLEQKPSYEDLARALLDITLVAYDRKELHKRLQGIQRRVASRLKEVGFHEGRTNEVWVELLKRYRGGWTMLRQRRTAAEMEAEGLLGADNRRIWSQPFEDDVDEAETPQD